MRRVTLVTGATGFAGRHLLDRLGSSSPIEAWYRPLGRQPDRRDGVAWRAVDILDRASVVRAVRESEPDRVFHLAGAPNVATSWKNVAAHLQTNAMGTAHLLEAVRQHGRPCRVLVVSSAHVYAFDDRPLSEEAFLRPASPYGFSKLAQDQLALRAAVEDGLDVVVARPFNHIGPHQEPGFAIANFTRQIARIERGLAEPVIRVGNLDARRDVTDVRDVVRAYVGLVERGLAGRPYNVCSGRVWRIRDLLDRLIALSTRHIDVQLDTTRLRPHDAPVIQGDASRIGAEVGWSPVISIEQTLSDTLRACRAEISKTG